MNKNFASLILSSIVTAFASIAQASSVNNQQVYDQVNRKVLCDLGENSKDLNCSEVEKQFDDIKNSNNVQTIYQLYLEEAVQLEMEYVGHGSGG